MSTASIISYSNKLTPTLAVLEKKMAKQLETVDF